MSKTASRPKVTPKPKIQINKVVGDKVRGHVPKMQNPPPPPPKKNK